MFLAFTALAQCSRKLLGQLYMLYIISDDGTQPIKSMHTHKHCNQGSQGNINGTWQRQLLHVISETKKRLADKEYRALWLLHAAVWRIRVIHVLSKQSHSSPNSIQRKLSILYGTESHKLHYDVPDLCLRKFSLTLNLNFCNTAIEATLTALWILPDWYQKKRRTTWP